MIRVSRSLVLPLVVFVCQAVCADETKTAVPKVQASASASGTIRESDEQKIEVKEGDWKAVQEYVAEQKGKIVVVDIWSTACLPCMREFPNLVSLQQKYGKEMVCVSLNVDYVGIKTKPRTASEQAILRIGLELLRHRSRRLSIGLRQHDLFHQSLDIPIGLHE